ncbi:hypothetical protein [Sneathiella glossodoripedis]|uniref:hypothetical protein n=1 Tax=Sneathiella glossodoripedis TaxID=418853 RepID=UPI00046F454C|nr:hypothetical protein [Sneathiella glossodoripedis]
MTRNPVKVLPPRLLASCKDQLFSASMDRYGDSDIREDLEISNSLYLLYLEFRNLADYILRRAPRVYLTPMEISPPGTEALTEGEYKDQYLERIDLEDDKLQHFTRCIAYSHFLHSDNSPPPTEDQSRFLLIDPERLIQRKVMDGNDPIYGFALYFTPRDCHRLVFFGAGTRDQASQLRRMMQEPLFDWHPFSTSYMMWRFRNSD